MEKLWLNTHDSFKSMIIGKLLGDGSITKQKRRRPRFQFIHMHTDFSWCQYCYEQLSSSIPLNAPVYKKVVDQRLIKGYSQSYYVQSRTSSIICFLRKNWYPDGCKVLPFQLIEKYFNNQTMAWWYMDDGHLKIKENIPQKIVLSTESFTVVENKWLINFLHQKYHLKFRIDKQNRTILYDQFQVIYFLNIIKPFLHESMHRKSLHYRNIKHKLPSNRTTIYLPFSINIASPTAEINSSLNFLTQIIDDYKLGVFYTKYRKHLFNKTNIKTKSYQIFMDSNHLSNLRLLKDLTGLTYSWLTEMCFTYNK